MPDQETRMTQPPALLEVREVAKSYGPVVALRSADLSVAPGEIHALLGANGAGKSTLVKILSGVLRPDSGVIAVAGKEVRFSNPVEALRAGIAPVFQDPALVPHLSVADNFTLTGTDRAAVRPWLTRLELDVDLNERVNALPLAVLRMLDLARALAHDPQLLLLDEMTAALPSDYTAHVFDVMREWRDRGRSVLFISHRLTEVQEVCDRATVLRDGRAVDTHRTAEGGEARIVGAMLGERAARVGLPTAERRPAPAAGDARLSVEHLAAGRRLQDVSFSLASGEVLGVVSLEGQGEDDLFLTLAGDQRIRSGRVLVGGRPVKGRHPLQAIRRGITLVPSDRLHAVLPQRSIRENLALPLYSSLRSWGWINDRKERRAVEKAVDELDIDTRAADAAKQLSGGNQQKLTIGRWLVGGYDVMLCFDPTRGIDVGTKHQIYRLLRQQAADGRSVLMFTSELREVPLVCDRVVVLHEGRIVAELPAADADEETLLHAMHNLPARKAS
jgi:ribose transport system ATP-binding protein